MEELCLDFKKFLILWFLVLLRVEFLLIHFQIGYDWCAEELLKSCASI